MPSNSSIRSRVQPDGLDVTTDISGVTQRLVETFLFRSVQKLKIRSGVSGTLEGHPCHLVDIRYIDSRLSRGNWEYETVMVVQLPKLLYDGVFVMAPRELLPQLRNAEQLRKQELTIENAALAARTSSSSLGAQVLPLIEALVALRDGLSLELYEGLLVLRQFSASSHWNSIFMRMLPWVSAHHDKRLTRDEVQIVRSLAEAIVAKLENRLFFVERR